jgi:U3 small nucleolar RNA-associated protein 11
LFSFYAAARTLSLLPHQSLPAALLTRRNPPTPPTHYSQARRRFGLLEKKSDYKARADDFHKKEDAIARLRAKADGRNPDEFSFGMVRDRTTGGVPVGDADAGRAYTADELALMRTQDVRYVAMAAGVEAKRIERLRASLHGLGAADAARASKSARAASTSSAAAPHTVFVDSRRDAARFEAAAFFDTPPELLGRAHNRPRRGQVAGAGTVVVGGSSAATPHARAAMKADKRRAASYRELGQRAGRLARLRALEGRLRLQGALQAKGSKRKVAGAGARGDPAVYKWRRVRTK